MNLGELRMRRRASLQMVAGPSLDLKGPGIVPKAAKQHETFAADPKGMDSLLGDPRPQSSSCAEARDSVSRDTCGTPAKHHGYR